MVSSTESVLGREIVLGILNLGGAKQEIKFLRLQPLAQLLP
jgi:hypothetical protein